MNSTIVVTIIIKIFISTVVAECNSLATFAIVIIVGITTIIAIAVIRNCHNNCHLSCYQNCHHNCHPERGSLYPYKMPAAEGSSLATAIVLISNQPTQVDIYFLTIIVPIFLHIFAAYYISFCNILARHKTTTQSQ